MVVCEANEAFTQSKKAKALKLLFFASTVTGERESCGSWHQRTRRGLPTTGACSCSLPFFFFPFFSPPPFFILTKGPWSGPSWHPERYSFLIFVTHEGLEGVQNAVRAQTSVQLKHMDRRALCVLSIQVPPALLPPPFSFYFFSSFFFFFSSILVPMEKWAKLAQAAVWNSEQQWWFTVIYIFGLHHALGSASHLPGGWIPSVFLFLLVFLSLQVCNSLWEAVPCLGRLAGCAGLGLHPSLCTSALPPALLTCLQTVRALRDHASRAFLSGAICCPWNITSGCPALSVMLSNANIAGVE